MEHGDFSPNSDPENPAFACFKDHIPIYPVRFSLPPYEHVRNPTKPSAIGSPGSYILRTLRRGFVYIYVERPEEGTESSSKDGLWYVFRYSTGSEDANSDVTPAKAPVDDRGSGMFVKYEWTDNYGNGEWKYGGGAMKTCWVPKWASKIWVAFSEYRWPPAFFKKGHDAAFRKQLMVEVNLRGKNGWAAYWDESDKLVEEFKPMGTLPSHLQARLNISQTGFTPISWYPTIKPGQEKCVALVAVHDVMGDIEEMSYRLQLLDDHQKNFAATYAYPLTIGQICSKLEPSIPKRDGRFERMFNDPALAPNWRFDYQNIHDVQRTMLRFMRDCTAGLCVQMKDEGPQMLGKHLSLAATEAQDNSDELAAEYYSVMLGRACSALNLTHGGCSILRRALGNQTIKLPDGAPDIKNWVEKFTSMWGGLKEVAYDRVRKTQYSFQIAFEAIAVQLSNELVNGGQRIANWQDALDTGFRQGPNARLVFGTQTLSLQDAGNFVQGIGGPYNASQIVGELVNGQVPRLNTGAFVNAGPTADIPYIRISTTTTLVGGIDANRRIAMADLPHNALAVFVSSWALFSTVSAYQKAGTMIEQGKFTSFTSSQGFQIAAATASVTDALASTYKAFGATRHTSVQISAEALETLYNGRALRGAAPLVRVSQPATALGRRLAIGVKALPYVAAIFGTIASIGSIVRGVEREDNAEIWGNAVMLVGGLLMIPGLGWIAAGIGAVLLAIGFLISLSSYNALEDVVRFSFWGSSKEYWKRHRPEAWDRVQVSKNLTGEYKALFEEEMARFGELTWVPIITNPTPNDAQIMVKSTGIAQLGIAGIEVKATAWDMQWTPRGHIVVSQKLNVSKQRIGDSDSMLVKLSHPHLRQGMKEVEIEVSVRGPRSGYEHTAKQNFKNP